jgi:ABC-type Co2+ transport system permease subunit
MPSGMTAKEKDMHIEPGVVSGAKILLSYATAAGAGAYTMKLAWDALRERGPASLLMRGAIATALVFAFFEILPHFPVGVSEVHFILGSTLFLIFGPAAAAIGLALGLLAQGLFFAPFDLPQYGMNLTTLLVPLFALQALAARIIAPGTPYVDLRYGQALALSTAYQGGVVLWVAFWAIYGQGLAGICGIATFGAAYMLVVLIEPLVDLAVLAGAKSLRGLRDSGLVTPRLYA